MALLRRVRGSARLWSPSALRPGGLERAPEVPAVVVSYVR